MRNFCLFLAFLFLGVAPVHAQDDLDVTEVKADPNTKLFNDGKHSVSGYVLSVLEEKTNCCGSDDIYVQVKYNENGRTTKVRVLNSSNPCNRKSLPDILKYVTWEVKDPNRLTPVFLALKPVIECEGSSQDNVYQEVPAPEGYEAGELAAKDPGQTDNAQPEPEPEPKNEPEPKKEPKKTPQPEPEPKEEPTADAQPSEPEEKEKTARVGEDAGKETTEEKDTSYAHLLLPTELPEPEYEPKDYKPNKDHDDSYANVSGPTYNANFGSRRTKVAMNVKRTLREQKVCGLAHILVELKIAPDGKVTGVRFLEYNDEEVRDAALPLLAGMDFTTGTKHTTYSIFEVKTFIDCTGGIEKRNRIKDVADYFYAPTEEKSAGAASEDDDEQDDIDLPRDR